MDSSTSRTLFRGARVFDGTGSPLADADVVVEDGRIAQVGPGLDGDVAVDLDGKTVLPGLFDCHTHVMLSHIDLWKVMQTPFSYRYYEAMHNLEATLNTGITTIRDAGGADLGIKRAVEDGLIRGPRMQISITMLSQTGGHGDGWMPSGYCVQLFPKHGLGPEPVVDGPDAMRKKVRELIRDGADVIKIATSGGVLSPTDRPEDAHFAMDELEVLVEEATRANRFVMAHAQSADGIKNAVRAGIRSIEHGIFLDDEAVDLMLANGSYLVPTLVAPQGVLDAAERGAAVSKVALAKAVEVVAMHEDSFRRAVDAGVKIAMGTDSAVTPHGENLRELELMEKGGMSPEEVLVATTSRAAELMGLQDDLGTIEPGKRADLLVIDGDPFDFSDLADRIVAVYQDGVKTVDRSG